MRVGDIVEIVRALKPSSTQKTQRAVIHVQEIRVPPSKTKDPPEDKCVLVVREYRSIEDYILPASSAADADDAYEPLSYGAEVFWWCLTGANGLESDIKIKDIRRILATHKRVCLGEETRNPPLICRYVCEVNDAAPYGERFQHVSLYWEDCGDIPLPQEPVCNASGHPTVGDFFSGAGGFSCGFTEAGFDVSMGVDHDQDACTAWKVRKLFLLIVPRGLNTVT